MVVVSNGLHTRPIGKRSDSVGHCKLVGTSGSSILFNTIFVDFIFR